MFQNIYKNCENCKGLFNKTSKFSLKQWMNRKFCSIKCARSNKSLENRFWEKVKKTDNCWEWIGAKSGEGYGSIEISYDKREKAHRVSWQLHYGKIPNKLFVLHKCDIKLCVNPKHLWLGTQKDNALDMINKNRGYFKRGELHPNAKLNKEEVKKIRILYKTGNFSERKLANLFEISNFAIHQIINKKTWKFNF